WNALFLHDSLPAVSAGSSPAWQRGRYLVNVLGHCGECHTPRGIAGEMELSRALTGFALSRVAAPDITPAGLASRGWTAAGLAASLGGAPAGKAWAFGAMPAVIMLRPKNLTGEDLEAVAVARRQPAAAHAAAGDRCDGKRRRERGGENELRGAVRRLPRP